MLLLTLASALLLAWVFAFGHEDHALAYFAYVLSAYTLVVLCLAGYRQGKRHCRREKQNRHVNRYLNDALFRTHVSLYTSFGGECHLCHCQICFGHSFPLFWFGSIAVYYFALR